MERNITKAIDQYDEFIKKHPGKGAFYAPDIHLIIEKSIKDRRIDPLDLVYNALRAGWITGYKAAKRERNV